MSVVHFYLGACDPRPGDVALCGHVKTDQHREPQPGSVRCDVCRRIRAQSQGRGGRRG